MIRRTFKDDLGLSLNLDCGLKCTLVHRCTKKILANPFLSITICNCVVKTKRTE